MRKKLTQFALPILLLSLFLPFSCTKTVRNDAYFETVSQYIYAHTGGAIGRTEPVRVRFVNAAVSQAQIGQAVDPSVFSVSPAIPGQAVWKDDRTIELLPGESLPYGTQYTAKIDIGSIYRDAPAAARKFEFHFSVRELSFDVQLYGLRSESINDPKRQQITGRLTTSDLADGAQVEKMLSAAQGNKNLNVSWSHAVNGIDHEFVISGVERSNMRSKVDLAWNGQPLGINRTEKSEQVVPGLDEFSLVNARVEQTDEQYVLLNFSDAIQASQDLKGLIRIDEYEGELRFVVDGNFVRVYPAKRVVGRRTIRIEAGIRNAAGAAMRERDQWVLVFEDLKPRVRLVGRGAIIPAGDNGSVIFPFEAVGLRAVNVEVFKIFNSNILQHLQVNEIEGENELDRVGKIILQRKVVLSDLNPEASIRAWQRYALDLTDLIKQDPGALYTVRLAFNRSYTLTECTPGGKGAEDASSLQSIQEDEATQLGRTDEDGRLISIMGSYRGVYFSDYGEEWYDSESEDYDWSNRDNPCKLEYYNQEHFAHRNVFVSDLGITGKRGRDGSVFIAVADLHSAAAVAGVNVEFFNFQLQSIGKASTGADGTVMVQNLPEAPFVALATTGSRRGYLRMQDGGTLSLSRFDVAGVELQKGLKGFLYGERGVWRPGDSIYLNFVLEDKAGSLPATHPVNFELTDPRGGIRQKFMAGKPVNGVFALHTATTSDAPTGNWTATVRIGGASFSKILKIETVKPNRLKLNLDFGKKELSAGDEEATGKLDVKWLHGAIARNLKAKVDLQVTAAKTKFKNFADFEFDDPARYFYSEPQNLFEGELNDNGQAEIPLKINIENAAPGKLTAAFRVRVFEKGGDFSTDNFTMDYHPYTRYVGVSIPKDKWGGKTLNMEGGMVQFAVVDQSGRPVPNHEIEVGLYRTDWRWWWDEDARSGVGHFNSANHLNSVDKATLKTDGRGLASWKVRPGDWGRYLVRVTDGDEGHASGDFFWSGRPDGADDIHARNAAAMLSFTVDKESYKTGDEVTLRVPAGDAGRILLTLETGSRIARHIWFDAKAGDNLLKFTATEDMAPTVYAHVSLIQPHAQTKNDLPIRMYGVMPVNVENPQTRLLPQIDMPEAVKPDEPFTVSVRETSGKACAYTLAIVDEGLLDLTRFQTPDPWAAFFAREALGVKTWDVYDYVLGAYGAQLDRILSIGGDGINQKAKDAQVNRFKPAVIHVGPFFLDKGQTAKHSLRIKNYVGSVRAMLVCSAPASGGKGAYGSTEKTVPVRKALMVLPTLPRVLSPGEMLRLPVDVFAMEKQVKNAEVRVRERSGLVSVQGNDSKNLSFEQPGNKMTYFELRVGKKTGVARFTVSAQSGGESASQDIEILVRNPNPEITTITTQKIEAGQDWTASYNPDQYTEIADARVEVSVLPPFNLGRHLSYLIRYPYGCVEQVTSSAFPQLYVDALSPLTPAEQQEVKVNVSAAIERLRNFQNYTGGFSYWPGTNDINDWSSSYAGHFLIEAQSKGYALPAGMLENWISYQTRLSRQWNNSGTMVPHARFDNYHIQAYRLYTLALSGKPELAGMNMLREQKDLYYQNAVVLAAAYAAAGKPEIARELTSRRSLGSYNYDWWGYTYGSNLRDQALLLEESLLAGDQSGADNLVTQICASLGGEYSPYWTTQTLATTLRALAKYASKSSRSNGGSYSYRLESGDWKTGGAFKLVSTVNFTEKSSKASIRNTTTAPLYASLIVRGRPAMGEEKAKEENIAIEVKYLDGQNKPLDVNRLSQGTDFVAEVTVKRMAGSPMKFDFTELALEQIFPAGWEILTSRLATIEQSGNSPMDYQDIRDDRIFTFFDLPFTTQNVNNRQVPKNETRTYRFQLNAAYTGRYYLPAVKCEAMYDSRIRANTSGRWIEII